MNDCAIEQRTKNLRTLYWYLLYTKPKKEDIVSERLRGINMEVYNPKLLKKQKRNGQTKEQALPLFPCYIFVKFDVAEHSRLIKFTPGVKRVLSFDGSPCPVPEEIIATIQSREKEGTVNVLSSFQEGDAVVIKDGPLKDFVGIFQKELSGNERVIVLLNTLSTQRIVLDRNLIEKL